VISIDRVRLHPWQVEVDMEDVAHTVGVHRHRPGAAAVRELLGQQVELVERVESYEHGHTFRLPCSSLSPR